MRLSSPKDDQVFSLSRKSAGIVESAEGRVLFIMLCGWSGVAAVLHFTFSLVSTKFEIPRAYLRVTHVTGARETTTPTHAFTATQF